MLIKKLNNAKEEIEKEIREVELICKEQDKLNGDLFLDTSLNFIPDINSLFLLYEGNKLVSLLSMFIPTSDEAEISAYTLPEYRRRGYFNKLLEEAIAEIKKYAVPDLVFTCEPQSEAGKETLKKVGAELSFTEYVLKYVDNQDNSEKLKDFKIRLKKAGLSDVETLIPMSQAVFNDEYEVAKSLITKTITSDNRIQYIGIWDVKPIGIVSVRVENKEASIFGVGILPEYQGKGLGKEIIISILQKLKDEGIQDITIEVDSSNEKAFHLYKKCGFVVETAFDYYRKCVI